MKISDDEIDEAFEHLLQINNALAEGILFPGLNYGADSAKRFLDCIAHFNFEPSRLLILSLTPDGDNTVIGRFMVETGQVYDFDFDLDDFRYSRLEEARRHESPGQEFSLERREYCEEAAGRRWFKSKSEN